MVEKLFIIHNKIRNKLFYKNWESFQVIYFKYTLMHCVDSFLSSISNIVASLSITDVHRINLQYTRTLYVAAAVMCTNLYFN